MSALALAPDDDIMGEFRRIENRLDNIDDLHGNFRYPGCQDRPNGSGYVCILTASFAQAAQWPALDGSIP